MSSGDAVTVERTRIGERFATIRTLIRSCAVIAGLYVSKDIIVALSGHETILALKLAFLGDWRSIIAYIAAISGLGWGFTERKLRHSTVNRIQGRMTELEIRVDPNRTSSGLTPEGKTNPSDKRR